MMNPNEIAAALMALAAEISGDAPAVTPPPIADAVPPPGYVFVKPTGVQGIGKVRIWPQPHPEQGETLLGYATRCMKADNTFVNPSQKFYAGGRWGPILMPGVKMRDKTMPEALDMITNPMDWMTQEELDTKAKLDARDAAGPGFSGGKP